MNNAGKRSVSSDTADKDFRKQTDNDIFALDIGTRTVIGVLGHTDDDVFFVDDTVTVPHKSRAMTDGQIEDIAEVARVVGRVRSELEERNKIKLENVSVAAAGRALRTARVQHEADIEDKGHISSDVVRSIEMEAVAEAQSSLNDGAEGSELTFYCVGHTVVKYLLDDYPIKSLTGHKGKKASAEIIAAFLPSAVVESLYSVTDMNGLSVRSLTLEPIAAMNVIIPPDVRLINIALVDIGAGTSDIAVSRDGSIVAYAMATVAGDEITEDIIRKYLVDFSTAEEMKLTRNSDTIKFTNILGIEQEISETEFYESIFPAVDMLADTISEAILNANGDAPAAVFLVGGGSKLPELSNYVAKKLGIPENRVAVGSNKFMRNVNTDNISVGGPEYVTPIGIGVTTTLSEGYDFSMVTLNGEKIRVFDTNKITVIDILRIAGYRPNRILGHSGRNLTYMLNGERKIMSGTLAEPAEITLNGVAVALDAPVRQGDKLTFKEAVDGINAECRISDIAGDVSEHKVTVDGTEFRFGMIAYVNGKHVTGDYKIQNYDDISVSTIDTLTDLIMSLPFDTTGMIFMKDGKRLRPDYYLVNGDEIISADRPIPENAHNIARQIAEKASASEKEQPVSELVRAAETTIDPVTEEKRSQEDAPGAPITVTLNGRMITLPEQKTPHEFLELTALANLDTKNPPAGKKMILTLNGKEAGFMDRLNAGDDIIIKWED